MAIGKSTDKSSRRKAAKKAWQTRRTPVYRARKSEAASKKALDEHCKKKGWQVVFFEGRTGSPRTGVVDAVMVRIAPGYPDRIEIRLVQLKGGRGGLKPSEVTRLKKAVEDVSVSWLLAAHDGENLHIVPGS
jgi:hypothetical protein